MCLLLATATAVPTGLPGSNGGRARRGRASSSRFVPLQSADNIAAFALRGRGEPRGCRAGVHLFRSSHPDRPTSRHRRARHHRVRRRRQCLLHRPEGEERRRPQTTLALPPIPIARGKSSADSTLSMSLSPSFPATPSKILLRGDDNRETRASKYT